MQLPFLETPEDQIVLAAVRALAVHGPLLLDDLADLLGYDVDAKAFDCLVEELDELDRVEWLPVDRLCDAVALLARVTLTHRLTAAEVSEGIVEANPDLLPLCAVADESLPLRAGGRLSVQLGSEFPTEQLHGPPGWLGEAVAGDLVGLRLEHGAVHVEAPLEAPLRPAPSALDGAARALREAADAALPPARELMDPDDEDPPLELVEVLYGAIADWGLSGVCPPLTEVAEAAGLALGGGMLFHDHDQFARSRPLTTTLAQVAVASVHFDLDRSQAEVLEGLLTGHRAGIIDEALVQVARVGFADAGVVEAFGATTKVDEVAAALAAALLDTGAGGRPEAGALYLLACRAEAEGDSLAAERHLEAAVSADSGLAPALAELATYVETRGDAARALRLARDAGLEPGDWQIDRLQGILAESRAVGRGAGRNDLCPCGSGRKHKKCCLGQAGSSPLTRASWVAAKAVEFVRHPARVHLLTDLAELRFPAQGGAERIDCARSDPLLLDLALFDLGGLGMFMDQLAPLLPAEERDLAASWAGSARGLYRVVRHQPGLITLQPTSGGPAFEAVIDSDCPTLRPRDLLLCRVVPVPAGTGVEAMLFAAGMWIRPEISPELEQALAAGATPAQLAALLAAGPRLCNKEGEPVVLCRRHYAVSDEAEADRAMAGLGLDRQDDRSYAEWIDVDGMPWLRGTVKVTSGEVVIESNSEARMDRLAARVEAALPRATLGVDQRTPAQLAIDDSRRFGIPSEPHEPPAELRQALGQFIREAERRWCDEPIPALDGRTPHEALQTPEGRDDLEALLAEMDQLPSGEGGFDVDRLRDLLGLPAGG